MTSYKTPLPAPPERPLVRVLRDRAAGRCLLAVLVSGFGTSALWLVSGVWTKELTGSDGLAALCAFALWAPTLAGPLLGAIADRVRRRRLLVAVNLALSALVLALFAVDGPGRLWLLFAVLFLYGACGVVTDAAESAWVAGAVPADVLGELNGLRMSVNEGVKIVAPLAGAALFAAYGGARVALLDAVTFVAAAGLFASVRGRDPRPVRRAGARAADGLRELWRHGEPRPLLLSGSGVMALSGVTGASVFAVVDGLGRAPAFTGVLYAVQGVGSVAAGALSGGLLRRLGARRFAAYGIALFALGAAVRAVPYDAAVLVGSAAIGVGLPCPLVAALTAVQRALPDEVLGRASAAAHTLLFTPGALTLAVGAGLVVVAPVGVLLPVVGGAGLLLAVACHGAGRRGGSAVTEPG
ncbi:MFS transporter [Streptomyces sp. NPDC059524]|uniref:MFS transporter n=1 Tax=Streptomyces sp. NPDC059524 TaxID=3346856 RepID=UPI00369A98E7